MTDFEKALEEASEKYAVANEQPTLNLERIKSANKIGARWSREFTVREICKWVVGEGQFIVRNHCPANLKRAIESHFTPKSTEYGGWE